MKCLTISDLIRILTKNKTISDGEQLKIHLQDCPRCRSLFNSYLTARSALIKHNSELLAIQPKENCLTPEAYLDYLENNISKKDVKKIRNHLAECDLCLNELVRLQAFLDEFTVASRETGIVVRIRTQLLPQIIKAFFGSRRRWRVAVIALSVLFITTFIFRVDENRNQITREQNTYITDQSVETIFPDVNEIITTNNFEFKWEGPQNVQSFSIILLNDEGEIIVETQTIESSFTIPARIDLIPNENYFWQISAILKDGRVIKSGMTQFSYRPQ